MNLTFLWLTISQIIDPTVAAYALATIGLVIHFGFTGLLNFGQAGFMAVGGYAFAITSVKFHWPVWGSLLATIIAAAMFALILGIPTLRLRADYLSIVTIAAAEIIRLSVKTPEFSAITGGSEGINGAAKAFNMLNPLPPGRWGIGALSYTHNQWWVRIVGWSLVLLACLLVFLLMRSPWGRVVKGIREDEDAVRSLGKNVFSYKIQALILGGVIGGIGGALFILPRSLQPDNYGTQLTFFLYTIMLLGGATTVFGPVVGSIIFWMVLTLTDGLLTLGINTGVLNNDLIHLTPVQTGPIRFILVGVALMLLVIMKPQGLFGKKKDVHCV
ncbi:branched-chain amino acid ABC transporter permease [Rathayibacter toxicus]|uniref:Branched-chain amino acid ABC transporter permease n=1 Tax=Rathayibacter toxicus TaxID=145458 RepID=A0A0C5BDB5_9MICO|nr:branched-chain amino acid ABC transporter permease [Rathayibacter toxicus]AJM77206.1 branched-chain amino acid ABC transporter permease [Rathayibacter toxicus]ALS56943.1 branched-chain amino acid ABC transporter permease [Rathayibacter toxicus]KKM46224.1 branched-chain amino acid ABC transporter permease [Rathayibacter toxicus]PPG23182.1 branched-chain amino acid ABC transporter permease [Rathayibacter toxicus]PPG47766.1 branched-chain amino acid ABC transporter permease [Rathayibacter toxi